MLNLLGCSKENFKNLLKNMHYRILEKDNEIFLNIIPKKTFVKIQIKKTKKKVHLVFLKI